MGFDECLFPIRRRWWVVTGLLFMFIISESAIPSECNDFGLRNIKDDEGDWGFFKFTGLPDLPCLMCVDGRRMSSLNAKLILPCLHHDQPTNSRRFVNYHVLSESTMTPLQTASDASGKCKTEYGNATYLIGEPMVLEERIGGGDGSTNGGFVIRPQEYLLEPSNGFPLQSVICIKEVVYENVRLANGRIVGATTEKTTSTSKTTSRGRTSTTTTTTSPTMTSTRVTTSTLPSNSSGMTLTTRSLPDNLPTTGSSPMSTSTSSTTSAPVTHTRDSTTQEYSASSRGFENTTSREDRPVTTFFMTSEESADSDIGLEAKEGSAFPIWWAFLVFPVIIVGLVALVLFGIWRRKMIDRRTKPMAKEKENENTKGISIQSEENEDRESSNEGTIYNPVYGNNEINDDPKTTPNGQQSLAAGVYYGEIRKGESINGEMIYNSAYDGLSLKGDDAMLTNAAYATISETNSRRKSSHNRNHKAEQNSQEVAENESGTASKKSVLSENMVVYETVDETEEGNKDRESKVEMIYNSAYADTPSNEKRDFKRDGDYSVVEGINSGEGSLYSRIDDKGEEPPENVAVNDGKAS